MPKRSTDEIIKGITMYTQSGYLPPTANLEAAFKRLREQDVVIAETSLAQEQDRGTHDDAEVEIKALKADVDSLTQDLKKADAGYDLLCRILETYTKPATVEDMSAEEREAYEAARSRGFILRRRQRAGKAA